MIDRIVDLQVGTGAMPPIVECTEGDTMWRWHFRIFWQEEPWEIPAGSVAMFTGKKADGNVFDLLATVEGTQVIMDAEEQITAAVGPVAAVVRIVDAYGKTVASCPLVLAVRPNPQTQGPMSDTVLSAYNDVLQLLGGAVSVPKSVSDWLEAHVNPETGYVLDRTLTIQGAAADAKAAGDSLGTEVDLSAVVWDVGAITSSGNVNAASTTDNASDFIPVFSSSTVEFFDLDLRTARYVCGYNKDKTKVITLAGGQSSITALKSNVTVEIPNNVKFVRVTRHKNTETVRMAYRNINKAIYSVVQDAIDNKELIGNSGVLITAGNKGDYFTDANNAPLNSIYRISRAAEIENTPYGPGLTTASGVYESIRDFAGYMDGTLITIGTVTAYRHQIFISGSQTTVAPQYVALYFRTMYAAKWSDWKVVSNTVATSASNIAIRKKMIAPYLDENGNPSAVDTGHGSNPQYMVDGKIIFNDFNDAPLQSVYQIDLDCDASVMANNPCPGRSSVLITTGFAYAGRHGLTQYCMSPRSWGAEMWFRYGYLQSAARYIWTPWTKITSSAEIETVTDALTATITNSGTPEGIEPTWHQGSVDPETGSLITSNTTRIYYGYFTIWNGATVHVPAGMKARVFYSDTQSIEGYAGPQADDFAEADFFVLPTHPYARVVFGYTDDRDITPAEGPADAITRYVPADRSLSLDRKAADAKATGEAIAAVSADLAETNERLMDAFGTRTIPYVSGGISSAGAAVKTDLTRIRPGQSEGAQLIRAGDFVYCDEPFECRIAIYNARTIIQANFSTWLNASFVQGKIVFPEEYVGLYAAPYIRKKGATSEDISAYAATMNDYVRYYSFADVVEGAMSDIAPIGGVACFEKIGVCGASWDSGFYNVSGTFYENERLSWFAALAHKNGLEFATYARHSLFTKTWLSSEYGLAKMLADEPCNLYVCTFLGTDSAQGSGYLGSLSDYDSGDYTQYPDTFYGNYGKIIEQIKAHAPKALIVMIGAYWPTTHTEERRQYFMAAANIAAHYGLPLMNWANDPAYIGFSPYYVSSHPTPILAAGRAAIFERLFNRCVIDYYDYFKLYSPDQATVELVPWSSGTDSQVRAMILAARRGEIDLQDDGGWAVGDVRTVTVGAFTGGGGVSCPQQEVNLMITSFEEYMSCGNVLQFDFKNCLSTEFRLHSDNLGNAAYYANTEMYQTTLPALVNAMPEYLRELLLPFSVYSYNKSHSTLYTVENNKLALRSDSETKSPAAEIAGEGAWAPYYAADADRIKTLGLNGEATSWFLRTIPDHKTWNAMGCSKYGTSDMLISWRAYGVAPFGCL